MLIRRILGVAGLIVASASMGTAASAGTLIFGNFDSAAGLQLSGTAAVVADGGRSSLRLTPAAANGAGSALTSERQQLDDFGFSTRFTFNIAAMDARLGGGDGFVFVLQGSNADLGKTGGTLNYSGTPQSLGIEFDTFLNPEYDPDGNHVGVDVNGNIISAATRPAGFDLSSGADLTAWIDYNPISDLLEVRLSDGVIRPEQALLAYTIDLGSVLGRNDVFAGFTGATGGAWSSQDIVSWTFADEYAPIDAAVPEPASWLAFIAGFGLIGGTMRRRAAATARTAG
jgi:hypothetical protein